jgi:hypothetical protein
MAYDKYSFDLASRNCELLTKDQPTKSPNAALVWKQMEDLLAPQLNFSVIDRIRIEAPNP